MTGRFERTLALLAIAAEIALGATVVAPVRGEAAVVICQRRSKLKLRLDACKSKETQVDASELGATGPAGPAARTSAFTPSAP